MLAWGVFSLPVLHQLLFRLKKNAIFIILFFTPFILRAEGFAAGTKVWTLRQDTPELVLIEELQAGDHCLSKNLETGRVEDTTIIQTSSQKCRTVTLQLASLMELANNINSSSWKTITVTTAANHKFFIPQIIDNQIVGEWQPASEIAQGTILMFGGTNAGTPAELFSVVTMLEHNSLEEEVFCLSLSSNHNYFISELGIIVHNFVPIIAGISFAFGGGEFVFTGMYVSALIGGFLLGGKASTNPQSSSKKDPFRSSSNDLSFDFQAQLLTDPTPRPIVPAILPRPPNALDASGSCASGGGPGGDPKPPKKDDDDEEKKKCERHEKAQKDLDYAKDKNDLDCKHGRGCDTSETVLQSPPPPESPPSGAGEPGSSSGSLADTGKNVIKNIETGASFTAGAILTKRCIDYLFPAKLNNDDKKQ